jgi:hypothetical protein
MLTSGELEEAVSFCERALQSGDPDLDLLNLLAIARAKAGRIEDAVGLFTQGCERPWAIGEFNLATLLRLVGRLEPALLHARRVVELAPMWAEARVLLALLLPSEKMFGGMTAAIEEFREAARLRPDWALPNKELGRTYFDTTQFAAAEAPLRRALALDEADAETHRLLSLVLIDLDRLPEALGHLRRAKELQPGWVEVATATHELESALAAVTAPAHQGARRPSIARYPRSAAMFDDLRAVIDEYVLCDFEGVEPLLSPTSRVFAFGSCFAANITRALKRWGVPADHVNYPEDINSTYANRDLLEWLRDGATPNAAIYERALGSGYRENTIAQLRGASVVIISLGVAPCFFDRETKGFVPTLGSNFSVSALLRKFEFRMTSVAENVTNLRVMIGILRELVPNISIVLTVSPVPLRATFERRSAVLADCVSKSTLRLAAEEILQEQAPGFYYWPSFEIVRWLSAHTGPVFGTEDGATLHVSETLVNDIMAAFVRVFGDDQLRLRVSSPRVA